MDLGYKCSAISAEQTAGGKGGCTKQGVCGKTAEVANLQDLLFYQLKGISVRVSADGRGRKIRRRGSCGLSKNVLLPRSPMSILTRRCMWISLKRSQEDQEELRGRAKGRSRSRRRCRRLSICRRQEREMLQVSKGRGYHVQSRIWTRMCGRCATIPLRAQGHQVLTDIRRGSWAMRARRWTRFTLRRWRLFDGRCAVCGGI